MTIPFLHWFQKAKARRQPAAPPTPVAPVHVAPIEKPSSERLRKTVMPNSTRIMAPTDALTAAAGGSSLGRGGSPSQVVLSLEPAVERTISLELADVLGQIPQNYLKPDLKPDADRRLLLNASALEKGMATGQPAIALSALYDLVPEIFSRRIAPSESEEVGLPFEKVLEQFNAARVREDQQRDPSVPQVQTPILQVTLEDTARFGGKVEPLEMASLPPVKVQPATAKSISEAEPESVIRSKVALPRPTRSTIPISLTEPAPKPPESTAPTPSSAPARIPFNLPPNGTGAPASERVPASSGPPVPTPAPGRLATKGRLKVSPPSDALRPKFTLVPGVERKSEASETPATPPAATKAAGAKESSVGIPLRLVLETVPPFQVHGNVSDVPADARVELPLSLIQPQLASGRIAIPPKVFRDSVPEAFREFFVIDEAETPVLLPLQEVLKNLPGDALKMRPDQEHIAVEEIIETPFSIKAKEDAARFSGDAAATPPAPKAEEKAPVKIENEKAEMSAPLKIEIPKAEETGPFRIKIDIEKSAPPSSESKEAELKLDEPKGETKVDETAEEKKFDAKEAVAQATSLSGVLGCSVTFSDGLIVAQKFPADSTVEGFCAAAPSIRQRIEQHTRDTTLGALKAMSLQGEKSAISLFLSGNICLTALHSTGELAADTRTKLAVMAEQLTKTYAQPESGNVDH